MNNKILEIVEKILSIDFSDRKIFLNQINEAKAKIEKVDNSYLIVFSNLSEKNRASVRNAMIRMDTYPNLNEVYTFELTISHAFLCTLKISKHDNNKSLDFNLNDISYENYLFSYDFKLFKDIKYLPVGTIVSLQKGLRKLMIYGRQIKNESDRKLYDYVGCFYPEGIRDFKKVFLFDAVKITKVHWLGMTGIEEEKLFSLMDKVGN